MHRSSQAGSETEGTEFTRIPLAEELAEAFSADSLFDRSVFLQETITKVVTIPINRVRKRIRVVFIQVGFLEIIKTDCVVVVRRIPELLEELLLFTTTAIEYKINSQIHFSYSDFTSLKIYGILQELIST